MDNELNETHYLLSSFLTTQIKSSSERIKVREILGRWGYSCSGTIGEFPTLPVHVTSPGLYRVDLGSVG